MTDNGTQPDLSPAALKFIYRLMGLKEKTKYDIMLVKLGDTWIYEIAERREKVECAQ